MVRDSRRRVLAGGLAMAALSGCGWRRRVPPVVLGGTPVAPDAPIMAALENSSEHRVLAGALKRSGLDEMLSGNGPLTLVAPTDRAFELFRPVRDLQRLRDDAAFLESVLRGHIFRARIDSEELVAAIPQLGTRTRVIAVNDEPLAILGGEEGLRWLDLRNRSGRFTVLDAIASNGLIHATDNVILPPSPKDATE